MNINDQKAKTMKIVSFFTLLLLLIVLPIASSAANSKKAEDPTVEVLPTDYGVVEESAEDLSPTNEIELFYDETLVAEKPIEEQLTQDEMDELILFDSEEQSTETGNVNQYIDGNVVMQWTPTPAAYKVNGSNIRWNINWTHQGRADIGVIGDNGIFYYLNNSGGSSIRNMNITLSQNYHFAIRNTISTGANFAGWRDL